MTGQPDDGPDSLVLSDLHMQALGQGLPRMVNTMALPSEAIAHQSAHLDRADRRRERIEQRLGLVEERPQPGLLDG